MRKLIVFVLCSFFLLPACNQGFRTETLFLEEDIPFREGSQNALDIKLDIDFPVAGYDREVLQAMCRNIRSHTLGENYTEFKGSLKDNITLGRDCLSDEAVNEACRNSCSDDVVSSKKEGLGYLISDGGAGLSLDISGEAKWYAAGGGGAGSSAGGSGIVVIRVKEFFRPGSVYYIR